MKEEDDSGVVLVDALVDLLLALLHRRVESVEDAVKARRVIGQQNYEGWRAVVARKWRRMDRRPVIDTDSVTSCQPRFLI